MRGVLLIGPTGAGTISTARKTARAMAPMSEEQLTEVAWIFAGAGLMDAVPFIKGGKIAWSWGSEEGLNRPFRAPHYTVSSAGLIGAKTNRIRPGEVSLAHNGCLVLDELPQFRKDSIRTLGETLRDGHRDQIPARPELLIATANVCGCGYTGTVRDCVCKEYQLADYTRRLTEYCDMLGITEMIPVYYPGREPAAA